MTNGVNAMQKPAVRASSAALKVALGGIFSLAAGMASQVITAYLFGAGSDMDAFFTAMTVPGYLQFALLGGLPFVVIPAFVREESSGKEEDAWALAGSFIWITGILLLLVAVLVSFASHQIIGLLAPGYTGAKAVLSAQMLSIQMFTIPFLGLGAFTSGIQNVRNRFFWPAAATAIGSVGNFVTLLILKPVVGPIALAWGALVAAVLFGSVTTIPVLKHGWKKTLKLNDPRLIEMLKLISPFIFFGIIIQGKQLLERYLASGLPDGQLSYIGYANKISNIFVILLATSVASAIFPAMARAFSNDGHKGLIQQADYGLRISFALALPAVTITTVMAIPLIQLIFEHGAFDAQTTSKVGILIPIVMLSDVLFRMISNMIGRTFFVLKDTLTTNLITSLTILVYAAAAYVATALWGYVGLTLAQPIQSGLAVLLMSGLLFHRVKGFKVFALVKSIVVYAVIAVLAALVAWGLALNIQETPVIFQLIVCFGVAGLVYLGLMWLFDRAIANSLLEMTGIQKGFSLIQKGFVSTRDSLQTAMARYQHFLTSADVERPSLNQSRRKVSPQRQPIPARNPKGFGLPNGLLLIAFGVGLITPLLISLNLVPDVIRWAADGAMAVMVALLLLRMLSQNHIPPAFWVIVFFSLVGILQSLILGQGMGVTLWGWWLMFQYPLVGLFCYLQVEWPLSFPKKLLIGMVLIAGFELLVQVAQYLMGVVPGDQLAGTFGQNGTGNLVLFLILVTAFALGEWLHTGKWILLAASLAIGLASSVLGEMKLYYLAVLLMGGISFLIFFIKGKQRWKVIPYLFLMIALLAVFIPLYNLIVPSANELPLEGYITNPALLTKYLTFVSRSASGGNYYYDIGRNFAVAYGWERISSNPVNLPFGYGLGARSESRSLGLVGRGLSEGQLGISTGTGALVIMQETGLAGMAALLLFIIVILARLITQLRREPHSDLNPLRYGLILFTILWPLWLWYNLAWNLRVPMLLYWTALGYVFGETWRGNKNTSIQQAAPEKIAFANQLTNTGELG